MPEFTIETGVFRRALATALPFAYDDDDLPLLAVVRIEPGAEDGTVEVAATDRFVLSVETLTVAGEPFPVSVPADVAGRLLALVPEDPAPGAPTTITRDDAGGGECHVTIIVAGDTCTPGHTCDTTISFTESGRFVNYRQILAKRMEADQDPTTQVAFTPALLAKAATAFAERNIVGDPLTMRFHGQHGGVIIEGTGGHSLKVLAMPARLAADAPPVPPAPPAPDSGRRVVDFADIQTP